MSIKRRLSLSFLTILLLFGVNLGIYFWGSGKRDRTLAEVQAAVARQDLVNSVSQDIENKLKQIQVLMSVMSDQAQGAVPPAQLEQFKSELESTSERIVQLLGLTPTEGRSEVEELKVTFGELSRSWVIFYQNLGVDHVEAITELAMHAEPLSTRIVEQLAALKHAEKERVSSAGKSSEEIQRVTTNLTLSIFGLSTLIAITVALYFSRFFNRRLVVLKEGAKIIGSMNLDHRIRLGSHDEFGELASAFNAMTEKLALARGRLTDANRQLALRNREIAQEKARSEQLLENILPEEIAKEIHTKGEVDPKYFEDVSILFTDFVGFTQSTARLSAEELVENLQDYFTAFDRIVDRYHLEKLKTIGDAYMCAGGLPIRNPAHPVEAVLAAFELLETVRERDNPKNRARWAVRIGIHTGPVIAGVVGIRKFAFDVWGDTVNLSSRMESSGLPNRINISRATYLRIKDFFYCEPRGKVMTKDGDALDMYFVDGLLPGLLEGAAEAGIPPAFRKRFQVYFQREPVAFPAILRESAIPG
ncbi:MAG: adenylate/guanylate cyclase domain-containing protein [Acidobacteriota bacterium]|jgi:class 3 adenylate cyclase/CHASE3 domain sensor protein